MRIYFATFIFLCNFYRILSNGYEITERQDVDYKQKEAEAQESQDR